MSDSSHQPLGNIYYTYQSFVLLFTTVIIAFNSSGVSEFNILVSAGTSNKISKCQKREIKPLYNN